MGGVNWFARRSATIGYIALIFIGLILSRPNDFGLNSTAVAPQVSLDIQALSQAYFGTPDLDMVRRAGRLTVHDEKGYAVLRAALDGPPTWMNDEF